MNKIGSIKRGYWYVVMAGLLSGTIVFGGKIFSNLGLSLYQIATLPFAFVVLFFLPFILLKKECRITRKMLPILLLFGLINALVALAEFGSVILGAPVAIAVLLLYSQPLWTIILSKLFLKEKINRRGIIACIVVLFGVILTINPFQSANIQSWPGIIVALAGGIFLSGWLVVGSYTSKNNINPISTLFAGRAFMLIILALLLPFLSIFVKNPSIVHFSLNLPLNIWIYIIVFSIFSLIINNLFYLNGVKEIPTTDAGIIVLLEPVSATILATIFLHQPLTLNIILGGILILFANYLVIIK